MLELILSNEFVKNAARAAYSSGFSLRMMFGWKSIDSSGFGSFDFYFSIIGIVSFFFLALYPRDAIANDNVNLTILTS